jgi:hypothetical protein
MRTPLGEVNRMATGPLAAGFADGDHHPPVFDPATGTVALPDSLRTAFQVLGDGGWWRLGAAFRYLAGPAMAAVVHRRGTAKPRHRAELMIDRRSGPRMALTEPDAGSDVGAGRTRAVRQPDGRWHSAACGCCSRWATCSSAGGAGPRWHWPPCRGGGGRQRPDGPPD